MCVCVHVCCCGFLFSDTLLIRRIVVLGGRVTCLPELPWASQLFIHSVTKPDETVT